MNKYFFIAICKLLHFLIFVSDSDALLCSGIHVAYMYIYMCVMCTGTNKKVEERHVNPPTPSPVLQTHISTEHTRAHCVNYQAEVIFAA